MGSKVCTPACLDAVAMLPPLPDIEAFQRECSASLSDWDVQNLEGVVAQQKMVSTVLASAEACTAAAVCAALDNCNHDKAQPQGECQLQRTPNTKARFASCSCYQFFTGETCQNRIPRKSCSATRLNTCTAHPIDWYQDDCSRHGLGWKYWRWQHCGFIHGVGGQYICKKDWTCQPEVLGHDCCIPRGWAKWMARIARKALEYGQR